MKSIFLYACLKKEQVNDRTNESWALRDSSKSRLCVVYKGSSSRVIASGEGEELEGKGRLKGLGDRGQVRKKSKTQDTLQNFKKQKI